MATCSESPVQYQCIYQCQLDPALGFCPAICAVYEYGFCEYVPDTPPITVEEQQAADSLYLSFAEGFGVVTLFCIAGLALSAILNLIKR